MYREGVDGVLQDYAEAVRWYRLAAEQGYAQAQYYLGEMYRNAQGFTQDYSEAVKWYRLSAEQGYSQAQYSLGGMYFFG
jgi:TPR repeat protein